MDPCTVGWKQKDRRKLALWPQAVCRALLEKLKSKRAGRKRSAQGQKTTRTFSVVRFLPSISVSPRAEAWLGAAPGKGGSRGAARAPSVGSTQNPIPASTCRPSPYQAKVRLTSLCARM